MTSLSLSTWRGKSDWASSRTGAHDFWTPSWESFLLGRDSEGQSDISQKRKSFEALIQFLTNGCHILKAGVLLPYSLTYQMCCTLELAHWSWYLFHPPDLRPRSSWQLQLVKLLKCRLVERQVGVGWASGGSNCTGGQNQPNPNHRTEMPPGRGEDRFEGKCTTEPVAHLWFVGQLRPVPRFFGGFSWFTVHQNHLQFFRYYSLWTFKASCLVIWGHCAEKADVGKGQPGPHLESRSVEGRGSSIKMHNKGSCQKRFSGFFPLRGGVPPLSAKLFWAQWFSVKGGCTPPFC